MKTRVLFNIMGTAMGKKRKVKHARTFVPVKVERKNKINNIKKLACIAGGIVY